MLSKCLTIIFIKSSRVTDVLGFPGGLCVDWRVAMQFRDLQAQYQTYKHEIDSAIQSVLFHSNYIEGREVKELEKD